MDAPANKPDGLHSPSGMLDEIEPPRRRSAARLALQAFGALVGLGLLAWAISIALSDKNKDALEQARHAAPSVIATLLGVSLFSLVLNGVMFWVVLRPLKKLNPIDVVLTNAIATFLSILPFKINLVVRTLIHHRRDGVPFRDIVSWFAAMAALAMAVLLPAGIAGLWRGGLDPLWWVTSLGGTALLGALGVKLGYLSLTNPTLSRLSLGSDRIVRSWQTVAWHTVLRLADLGLLCARFAAAAAVAGHTIPAERLVLLGTTYFLLSVLAPFGSLGFRETITAAVGMGTGLDQGQITLITLIVTAGETAVAGVLALAGFVKLRPDRLTR